MPLFTKIRGPVRQLRFRSSARYWDRRYRAGGTSGSGSYGADARFKAQVVNDKVARLRCQEVVELGCGDGNQVRLFDIPHYYGVDVAPRAVGNCKTLFEGDPTRVFLASDEFSARRGYDIPERFDCALSLDVIYHLVEDDVYRAHLSELFGLAPNVIIYSSTQAVEPNLMAPHVRHRNFLEDVRRLFPRWVLEERIPNPRRQAETQGPPIEFFVFRRGD